MDDKRPKPFVGIAAGALAVLVITGAWFLFDRSSSAPSSTTLDSPRRATTETTATSTTMPETRPAAVSQVATAKPGVDNVIVWEAPPPDWEALEPAIVWEAPELPASAAEFPDAKALPNPDLPIVGRYRTPFGWEFSNPSSPPFSQPFSMLVTEQRGNWAEVMIPVRPNGTRGYIDTSQVDLSQHDYRVELDLSERRLVAYKGSEAIAETLVVIGNDSRRTPTGRFYITDKSDRTPSAAYGTRMLPLNVYSEQLDRFSDGVPVIAMHGTSRPDLIGQAASNGCVRMPNEVVELLYDQLPVGTQVEITA
ncbi:MAG: L,D-transpeptidase [Actinomycetia bacterium]|nr:L,D-transpeptidase [Actinomycetes bacterium]